MEDELYDIEEFDEDFDFYDDCCHDEDCDCYYDDEDEDFDEE